MLSNQEMMSKAIRVWMKNLDQYPGWKDWNKRKIRRTLLHGDPFAAPLDAVAQEFKFSEDIEMQHALIMQYLELVEGVNALKECEYYFRRFPFRGLPVTMHGHLLNVSEMYFARFYEFKEKLKKYLNTLKSIAPHHGLEIGKFIKLFEKEFEPELKERNGVHHHQRFSDLGFDQILVIGLLSIKHEKTDWSTEHIANYRRVSKEWVLRVRRRAATMEKFLEIAAKATLENCQFLSEVRATTRKKSK